MKKCRRKVVLLSLNMVCILILSGCFKTGKKGRDGGVDPNVIGGVRPEELGEFDEYGLGTRFEENLQPYPGGFAPVYFAYDSARIQPSERGKMDVIADEMRRNSNIRLIIEGHCDERGDREYNLALGERRALGIRAYLIGLGIETDRIQTKSFGEENPVAFGHDDESHQLNRRGEFKLFN